MGANIYNSFFFFLIFTLTLFLEIILCILKKRFSVAQLHPKLQTYNFLIFLCSLIHCLDKYFSVASSLFAPKAPTHHNRTQMAENLHSPNLNIKINCLISLLFFDVEFIQINLSNGCLDLFHQFTRFLMEGAFGVMLLFQQG